MRRDPIHSLLSATSQRIGGDWSALLDAVGTRQFEDELKRFLSTLVGSEGCAHLYHDALGDPVKGESDRKANESLHWVHFDDGPWHAALAVQCPHDLNWEASSALSQRLVGAGGALSAIVRKHVNAASVDLAPQNPLSCRKTIERVLAGNTALTRREIDVCSRVLYGMSSAGIAIDLNLSETTVNTYRKRAYQRLSIGCERELITSYLGTLARCGTAGKNRPPAPATFPVVSTATEAVALR